MWNAFGTVRGQQRRVQIYKQVEGAGPCRSYCGTGKFMIYNKVIFCK